MAQLPHGKAGGILEPRLRESARPQRFMLCGEECQLLECFRALPKMTAVRAAGADCGSLLMHQKLSKPENQLVS
jgi:hypothetical protein